jgi:hypothetical protein
MSAGFGSQGLRFWGLGMGDWGMRMRRGSRMVGNVCIGGMDFVVWLRFRLRLRLSS